MVGSSMCNVSARDAGKPANVAGNTYARAASLGSKMEATFGSECKGTASNETVLDCGDAEQKPRGGRAAAATPRVGGDPNARIKFPPRGAPLEFACAGGNMV